MASDGRFRTALLYRHAMQLRSIKQINRRIVLTAFYFADKRCDPPPRRQLGFLSICCSVRSRLKFQLMRVRVSIPNGHHLAALKSIGYNRHIIDLLADPAKHCRYSGNPHGAPPTLLLRRCGRGVHFGRAAMRREHRPAGTEHAGPGAGEGAWCPVADTLDTQGGADAGRGGVLRSLCQDAGRAGSVSGDGAGGRGQDHAGDQDRYDLSGKRQACCRLS